jgi:hypothetical protein
MLTNADELNDALSSNYMLVSLSIRTWSGKRTDRSATDELIQQKHAAKDSGSFVKKLLASADTELRDVHSCAAQLRLYLYANTLPWTLNSDGAKRGDRLVATGQAMNFLRDTATLKRDYDDAVLRLQAVWPQRVQEAMANLGSLADAKDYPDPAELPDLFSVAVDIRPMPAISDFSRMNVPAQLQSALAQRMAMQMETQMKNAMNDLKERLLLELNRISTQLEKAGNGEKTKLFDTLVTNCQSLVTLARNMNLSGSEKLNELADKIEARLLSNPVEVYRNDKTRAAATAQEAKALLAEAEGQDIWY